MRLMRGLFRNSIRRGCEADENRQRKYDLCGAAEHVIETGHLFSPSCFDLFVIAN